MFELQLAVVGVAAALSLSYLRPMDSLLACSEVRAAGTIAAIRHPRSHNGVHQYDSRTRTLRCSLTG